MPKKSKEVAEWEGDDEPQTSKIMRFYYTTGLNVNTNDMIIQKVYMITTPLLIGF